MASRERAMSDRTSQTDRTQNRSTDDCLTVAAKDFTMSLNVRTRYRLCSNPLSESGQSSSRMRGHSLRWLPKRAIGLNRF